MFNGKKLLTTINVFVYQATNGHLGSKLGRQSILLLHTLGRKSGKDHITSLAYYREGETYLVVGSNWGKESQPAWFHNLLQHPDTIIQVGPKKIAVSARQAQGDEYQRLWKKVTSQYNQYIDYQKQIKRRIPIIILTPGRSATVA